MEKPPDSIQKTPEGIKKDLPLSFSQDYATASTTFISKGCFSFKLTVVVFFSIHRLLTLTGLMCLISNQKISIKLNSTELSEHKTQLVDGMRGTTDSLFSNQFLVVFPIQPLPTLAGLTYLVSDQKISMRTQVGP